MFNKKDRLDNIFSIESTDGDPIIRYISKMEKYRNKLYEEYANSGINLPSYERFDRVFLKKEDMIVLERDYNIVFTYRDAKYSLKISRGACFDAASVPWMLSYGRLTKVSQYVLMPSLVHDVTYALKYFPKNDCDNIFEGCLRYTGCPKHVIFLYRMGVRVGGGFAYNRKYDERHWLADYAQLVELDEYGEDEIVPQMLWSFK